MLSPVPPISRAKGRIILRNQLPSFSRASRAHFHTTQHPRGGRRFQSHHRLGRRHHPDGTLTAHTKEASMSGHAHLSPQPRVASAWAWDSGCPSAWACHNLVVTGKSQTHKPMDSDGQEPGQSGAHPPNSLQITADKTLPLRRPVVNTRRGGHFPTWTQTADFEPASRPRSLGRRDHLVRRTSPGK